MYLSQQLKPGEADNFPIRICSDKSAHYDLNFSFRSAQGDELSQQHILLDIFVPNGRSPIQDKPDVIVKSDNSPEQKRREAVGALLPPSDGRDVFESRSLRNGYSGGIAIYETLLKRADANPQWFAAYADDIRSYEKVTPEEAKRRLTLIIQTWKRIRAAKPTGEMDHAEVLSLLRAHEGNGLSGETQVHITPMSGAQAVPPPTHPAWIFRPLTETDTIGKSRSQIQFMINEIFAAAGKKFNDPRLNEQFKQLGYTQRVANPVLDDVQKDNVTKLTALRDRLSRGY